MIVIFAFLLGAFLGYRTAKRRGGNRLDMAQYAAVYAIVFTLVGLFLTFLLERLAA